ncbi:methyltransferase [Paraphotobacterium marinum]|uniref:methyltransferase n=1 Tax=Paraphotobacterium marinum TaxID=1755811 RepID=UPI0039EC9B15
MQRKFFFEQQLFDLILGPIRWEVFKFSLENNLFDWLSKDVSSKELSKKFNWCPTHLELILNALTSMDILSKKNQFFKLKEAYLPLLSGPKSTDFKKTLLHLNKIKHINFDSMSNAVKGIQDTRIFHENYWTEAANGLLSFHKSIRNKILISELIKSNILVEDFKLLDIGAGSSTLAKEILNIVPSMQFDLFDLPHCAEMIEEQIPSHSKNMIKTIKGDMNKSTFLKKYNVVLTSMCLYFSKNISDTLQKIKNALLPDGYFVSFHECISKDRTKPQFHVVGRLPIELRNGPLSLDNEAFKKNILNIFEKISYQKKLNTPFGTMEILIAQKSN